MRPALRSAALLALPLFACKPSSAPLQAPATPSTPAAAPTPPNLPPATPPPAVVYGHVRIPSPTGFLAALRTSPLPEQQRTIFDETTLRGFAGLAFGARSAVAEHVDLTRPMGCVVTSFRLHDIPLACVVGYQGGFARLVQDLGPQGFVSGGDDYAAYRFESQAVYLAAMGDHVAVAFAPDLIAATRDRLQRDLVDAPVSDEEVIATAFPSVIFSDAREQILDALVPLGRVEPGVMPGQAAIVEMQRKQWLSWGELERADLWLDVAPQRVRFGYRGTAVAGSATAKGYEGARAVSTVPAHRSPMAALPASSLFAMGMRFDMGTFLDDPFFGGYADAMLAVNEANRAVAEQYRKGLALWGELSSGHAAGALLHERGTKGGAVLVYGLRPGVDAVPKLRAYFEAMQASTPPEAFFTTELRPGALRVGKLRADVLTMKPSAAFLGAPGGDAVAKALGSPPRIEMAFVQRGDTLVMAMAPAKVDRYLKRALAAAGGKDPLGNVTATRELLEANAGSTVTFAVGLAGIIRWLDQIDAIEPVAFPIADRHDDVVVVIRPAGERQRELTIDLSATMLDALFKLGG